MEASSFKYIICRIDSDARMPMPFGFDPPKTGGHPAEIGHKRQKGKADTPFWARNAHAPYASIVRI